MLRLVVFGALLALLTWWLYRRLTRPTELGPRARSAVAVALGVLWALALIGVGSGEVFATSWARPLGAVGWVWLAAGLYLVLGLGVIALGTGVDRVIRRRRGVDVPTSPGRRRFLRIATGAVVVAAVGAAGYGVVEASTPRVVRVRIPLRRLPAEFAGTRLVLLTDLHVGPARGIGFTRKVVDIVAAENSDLILIGGDLVDGTVAKVGPDLEPLAELRAPLGVFGVSGNHEFYAGDGGRWLDLWDRLGIHTLRNTRVELRRGDAVVDLAGIHDLTSPAPFEPDLDAALAGRDPERAVILLAHQPAQVVDAERLGVDLQLSGHTHGGQMWPLGYLVPLQQPSVTGLDRFGDTVLYTSRGAGAWGPPVRVGAPPEITVIELVRA
ncbi:metallophosphoesterase [Rhodococcus gannanensis]|uniref:Metallophosphoesterase n=1 Tax=Rhodococcus gannanensis TaxID=1960308 RepID=A0ABW4P6I8_9NOCA